MSLAMSSVRPGGAVLQRIGTPWVYLESTTAARGVSALPHRSDRALLDIVPGVAAQAARFLLLRLPRGM